MALPHTILCVDDEINILNVLKRLLRKENYELLTATSVQEALDLMASNTVHLVMADQRMPVMSGTELFEIIKKKYPDVIRIVLTGYTEIDAITSSINKGNIYKCFFKPWHDDTLKLELRKALDHYDLVQLNRSLTEKIAAQNQELKTINDSLEQKVKARTHDLEIRNQALELSRAILDQLPYPVLGIDTEGFIVMANRKAASLANDSRLLVIGDHFSNVFDDAFENRVATALQDQEPHLGYELLLGKSSYRVDILPLTGRYRNQGALVVFNPAVSHHPIGG
jgi:response regulator RpfG family c-di-GMP phosphodiesterase